MSWKNVMSRMTYAETNVDDGILDILRRLLVKYRDVFLLKYSGNMDNDEIAKVLNIIEGTIRQRLSRKDYDTGSFE